MKTPNEDKELLENMARAIYIAENPKATEDEVRQWWHSSLQSTRAALKALKPSGYVIVPAYPTPEMIQSGSIARLTYWNEVTEPENRHSGIPEDEDCVETLATYEAMIKEQGHDN